METKITTLIVDDESNSRYVLRNLLEEHEASIVVVGEAKNVEEAYRLADRLHPQLVFLDIKMPRADGFSLLGKYTRVPFEVIFVTSYDKYAINAIKFSALDYLLKPVEAEELDLAVKKAVERIRQKLDNRPQIVNLLHNLGHEPGEHKIAVHRTDSVKLIDAKDIAYIEADGSYCHITTSLGERYVLSKYLKDFEDHFGDNSFFVRINKSVLLNTRYITRYTKGEPCTIQMYDGQDFEVSRRKKHEVLEKIK